MSNLRPAPGWLTPRAASSAVGAMVDVAAQRRLKSLGLTDRDIAALQSAAAGVQMSIDVAACEIIRAALSVLEPAVEPRRR